MKNLLKFTLILISLLGTIPALGTSSNTLNINTQTILNGVEGEIAFFSFADDNLYLGRSCSSDDSLSYVQKIEIVDLSKEEIKHVVSIEKPLRKFSFTNYHKHLILLGGETTDSFSSTVYTYKGKDKVDRLPNLPKALILPIANVIGDQLIVIGGESETGVNLEGWKLDLKDTNSRWEAIAPLPYNEGVQQQSIVQNGGDEDFLYVFSNKALTYSIKRNEWLEAKTASKEPIRISGQQPITMGTHHILFLDSNGNYCTYHTVTGQWDSNNFQPECTHTNYLCKWESDYMMLTNGELTKVSFASKVSFGWLNYGVLIVYMVLMLGIGFYFSRRASTSDQFFKGGGQIPWWAAGISIFATTLSAITFMALPAKAYTTNWLYFPMSFSILLMAPIVIKWYLPFFRRLNLTTAYEYLEKRFNLTVRLTSSVFFIVFMVMRIGIVLYLPSVALSTVTGIDLLACILVMSAVTIIYSTMGGVEAVVWGDVIQGGILVFGAIISVVYLVVGTGGFMETISIGISADKFKMLDFSFDFTQPTFWVIFFGAGLANSLITYTSDQTIVQRYLTTADMDKTRRSLWLNGLIALPVLVLFYFIGTALYTFFYTHPELLPVTMSNAEGIFPYFIVNELPAGIAGLLIAAIFAATMSTLSSNINSASTAITVDFAKRMFPTLSDKSQVNTARISGVLVGILGTYLAIELSMMSVKSFFDEFNTFIGLLTSGLGGLFAIGIFLPRVRGYAALLALVSSVFILLWIRSNSSINFMLYGLVGILLSLVLALLFSYIIPEKKKDLEGLTWKQRRREDK
ncbi:MAG: sodium:solute symporter family transporter [Phocaeicola sp.]